MNIVQATREYESWLGQYVQLVPSQLRMKHDSMRQSAFSFLRATCYRWEQILPEICSQLATAPLVLAVGDLHLENCGTWRDVEGRLVWGINDFDECTRLPWSQDLARLATSAHLAIADGHLQVRRRDACAAILDGYREGLEQGPRPYALEERNTWLRRVATSDLRDPAAFWAKMDALPTARGPDASAVAALRGALPAPAVPARICRRVAGMGSLGRPRFVALADWRGGRVAREAKAWAPSAWVWSARQAPPRVTARAVARSPDPTVHLVCRW